MKGSESTIIFKCNKCSIVQNPDPKQSNNNWDVFPNVKCVCGGSFEPYLASQKESE
jgi:hypothetical protein